MYIPREKKNCLGLSHFKTLASTEDTTNNASNIVFPPHFKTKKKMPYHNFNCSRVTSGFVVKKLYRQFHAQHLLAILQQVMSTSGETQEQTKPYIKHVKKEES
uniref:Uncharacterized protein n=1 Tax=Ixodes ricinus TaxID=34613 RepID=A0A6B0UFK3_IXORI